MAGLDVWVASVETVPQTDKRRICGIGLGKDEGDRLDRLHPTIAVAVRFPSVRKVGVEVDNDPDRSSNHLRDTNCGHPRMVAELSECASYGVPQFHGCVQPCLNGCDPSAVELPLATPAPPAM